MLKLSRRSLFLSIPVMGLAACTSITGLTLQQAIADALGIAINLRANLPIIEILFPDVIGQTGTMLNTFTNPQGTGWLDDAIELLTGLATASPAAVSDLTIAEKDINLVLNVLEVVATFAASLNPAIAAVALIVQAAISLAPAVEALISKVSTKAFEPRMTSQLRFKPKTAAMMAAKIAVLTPDQARKVLKIKTV